MNPLQLIDDTLATAQSDCLTGFQNILGRTIQPSDPEMLMVNFMAYMISKERATMNYLINSQLLAFATGPLLEDIASWFGVYRLPAANSTTTLQFTIQTGASAFVVPAGTRVQTNDGAYVFATNTATNITVGTTTINIDATCTSTDSSGNSVGTAANGYVAGTINNILDPIAFVSAVANITTSEGGSDEETDDELRARIPLASSTFSVAGPQDAYIYWAKTADAAIVDVNVQNPSPNVMNIYPLLAGGIPATTSVLDEVAAILNDRKIRPMTDIVNVLPPTQINYTINVGLILKANADPNVEQPAALAALQGYVNQWTNNPLGKDVVRTQIIRLAMTANTYDCVVNSPAADISVDDDEFAYCTGVTVTVLSISNEQ